MSRDVISLSTSSIPQVEEISNIINFYQVSGGDKHGKLPSHIVIPVKLAVLYVQTAGAAIGFIAHNGIIPIDV